MDKNFSGVDLNRVIKGRDTDALVSSLSDEDKKLLNSLLNDEAKRKEFLSSKEAKAIMSSLFRGR